MARSRLTNDAQRAALRAFLGRDPADLGFDPQAMTTAAVLDKIKAAEQSRPRASVRGIELFGAIDKAEIGLLPAAGASLLRGLIGRDDIDLNDAGTRDNLLEIFDAPTFPATRANLSALRTQQASRLDILGLPEPTSHQVDVALGRV